MYVNIVSMWEKHGGRADRRRSMWLRWYVGDGERGGGGFNRYKIPHLEITLALQNIILPHNTKVFFLPLYEPAKLILQNVFQLSSYNI